jgi:hypothetical protein
MLMEKDGIRIDVLSVPDQARYKRLGYVVVIAVDVAPPAELGPDTDPALEPTPEAANEEAIQDVNESKAGSKTKESKK